MTWDKLAYTTIQDVWDSLKPLTDMAKKIDEEMMGKPFDQSELNQEAIDAEFTAIENGKEEKNTNTIQPKPDTLQLRH